MQVPRINAVKPIEGKLQTFFIIQTAIAEDDISDVGSDKTFYKFVNDHVTTLKPIKEK